MTDAYTLGCPECDYSGGESSFGISLAGECWCPKCGCAFEFHGIEEDDEDEE